MSTLTIERPSSENRSPSAASSLGVGLVERGLSLVSISPIQSERLQSPTTSSTLEVDPSQREQEDETGPSRSGCEFKSLLDGFKLLRRLQLVNYDVHYINEAKLKPKQCTSEALLSSRLIKGERLKKLLKLLADSLRIWLSFVAILISVGKLLACLFLCLLSRDNQQTATTTFGGPNGLFEESKNDATPAVTTGWCVLIAINFSSTLILFSTIFNGHLLCELLGQPLFLVAKRFQIRTMLALFVVILLEYIFQSCLVSNLLAIPSDTEQTRQSKPQGQNNTRLRGETALSSEPEHWNHEILSNLEAFVTERHQTNRWLNILLGLGQFARGIIRLGPFITMNYCIICLRHHIEILRNQRLLTDSLKRRQRLKMVVASSSGARALRASSMLAGALGHTGDLQAGPAGELSRRNPSDGANLRTQKRVLFASQASPTLGLAAQNLRQLPSIGLINPSGVFEPAPGALDHTSGQPFQRARRLVGSCTNWLQTLAGRCRRRRRGHSATSAKYLDRVRDFHELETSIIRLYIFAGHLNRLMSRLGLGMFFVAHNLLISCSLIAPQAIGWQQAPGPQLMVHTIQAMLILVAMLPFVCGQSLGAQLARLSKQIDRIIILQRINSTRRDHLVRTRELLHDIRLNCAGMLAFNVQNGLFKYLLVAFACAFFIEQRGE